MTASDENDILTADDIVGLNRQTVARAAAFARLVGTALVVAAAVILAAWAWTVVRDQLRLDDYDSFEPAPAESVTGEGPIIDSFDVSFADRLDGLALTAVVAVGLGVGLRLFADYSEARTGGSLTGFEAGDRV